MFETYYVSNIDLDRLSAEIHFDGQILCQVYKAEHGVLEINFSCDKYLGLPLDQVKFPLDAFRKELDAAVSGLW